MPGISEPGFLSDYVRLLASWEGARPLRDVLQEYDKMECDTNGRMALHRPIDPSLWQVQHA